MFLNVVFFILSNKPQLTFVLTSVLYFSFCFHLI